MTHPYITVLYKKGMQPWHTVRIPNTLDALQYLVEGYIEPVQIGSAVSLLVNEEGVLRGMPPTLCQFGTFAGPVVLLGVAGEDFCAAPQVLQDMCNGGLLW